MSAYYITRRWAFVMRGLLLIAIAGVVQLIRLVA